MSGCEVWGVLRRITRITKSHLGRTIERISTVETTGRTYGQGELTMLMSRSCPKKLSVNAACAGWTSLRQKIIEGCQSYEGRQLARICR